MKKHFADYSVLALLAVLFFGTACSGTPPTASVAVQPVKPPQQPAPVVQPPPTPSTEQSVQNIMVRIEGGTFLMGSNNGYDHEKPIHSVTVNSFYMGKHEVTQKEWLEVMGTTVEQQRDKYLDLGMGGEGDNYPMYCVSWYDAVEYCNKLSQREGLTPAYTINKDRRDPDNKGFNDKLKWQVTWNRNVNGYRLPTEAEWEYAARGGNGSAGNYTYSGSNSIGNVAWYDDNSGYTAHPVGTKTANSLGIYDMSGNVWEWCWDWYDSYSSGSQTNPVGASTGGGRVQRGGGWSNRDFDARSAFRGAHEPTFRLHNMGFRLVKSGDIQ